MTSYFNNLLSWMADELPTFLMTSPVADFMAIYLLSFVVCLVYKIMTVWRG